MFEVINWLQDMFISPKSMELYAFPPEGAIVGLPDEAILQDLASWS